MKKEEWKEVAAVGPDLTDEDIIIEDVEALAIDYAGRLKKKIKGGAGTWLAGAIQTMRANKFVRPDENQTHCWECYEELTQVRVFVKRNGILRLYPIFFCANPNCENFMEPL